MSRSLSETGTFPCDLFAGRRYAVLGLGRNGAAAATALAGMGAEVTAWDDGEAARAALAMPVAGVRVTPIGSLAGLDGLVLSPGIPHRLPVPHPVAARALAEGVPVLSDAELLFEAVRRRRQPGALRRHHRHQRQVHHHHPAGTSADPGRHCERGRRQSRTGGAVAAATR